MEKDFENTVKNTEIIENSSENNKETEGDSFSILQTDISEKVETKGLKLKKSTKDRLNQLQSKFDDAESMVLTLLSTYNSSQIENDEKFLDRKAEIERFNYLIDSLKGAYVNSLEMATYAEEKCMDKFKKEIQRKELLINTLQEDNSKHKEKFIELEKEKLTIQEELASVKDSFSRVNLALSTVEKELKEKSDIIQNTQKHIDSLNKIIEETEIYKKENSILNENLKELEGISNKYELSQELLKNSKEESIKNLHEIETLKGEVKKQGEYSKELNEKIQTLLTNNSLQISKINEDHSIALRDMQEKTSFELLKSTETINKLKEEIFYLKLENERLKNDSINNK